MKHSKLLLLPLLLMATSCVSISKEPLGPSFDPDNGNIGEDPNITYYADDTYGDTIPSIPEDAKKLDFSHGKESSVVNFDDEGTSISEHFKNNDAIVSSYTSKNVLKGCYGILLSYISNDRNNFLEINLKEGITAQYLSINCSPTFYNKGNTTAPGYEFVSDDAAIQVMREQEDLAHKFVKLKAEKVVNENEDTNAKHFAKTYNVTFDLGSAKNTFKLKSYSHSVVINSITLF